MALISIFFSDISTIDLLDKVKKVKYKLGFNLQILCITKIFGFLFKSSVTAIAVIPSLTVK